MTEVVSEPLRNARTWLVGAVLATGSVSWLAVAWASRRELEFSGRLGVVGIALVLGSAEVAYLVWRNWVLEQRTISKVSASGASLGSLLILIATLGGVTAQGFVLMASGVGLLGLSTAAGLLGVYRATGKSTAATMTAMVIALALAYFASVLWAAVP